MSKKLPSNLVLRGKTYYIRFSENGKDKWRSAGTSDKQKAKTIAEAFHARREQDKLADQNDEVQKLLAPRKVITFQQARDQYISARSAVLKAASLYSYNNYGKHLLPEFGDRPLHLITIADVEDFKNYLVSGKSLGGKSLGGKYANEVLRHARSICAVQVEAGVISQNPFAGVVFLREDKGASRQDEIDPLSAAELSAVLASLSDEWRPIFTLLAYTGMRPGEAFALKWKSIDLKTGEAKITANRVRGTEDSPKTASSKRVVYLIPPVVDMLRSLKRNRTVHNLDDYVFVARDGMPYDKHIDGTWRRALKNADIRHRSSYQLRHSYISLALQNGIEPGWIQRQVGHSNLKMIYETYAKWIPGSNKENENRLSVMFAETFVPVHHSSSKL
jgi:integrase